MLEEGIRFKRVMVAELVVVLWERRGGPSVKFVESHWLRVVVWN